MARKCFTAGQIIGRLRQAEVMLSQSSRTSEVSRAIGVKEQTYYRWRRAYGGLKVAKARRLKVLEKENARLHRAVWLEWKEAARKADSLFCRGRGSLLQSLLLHRLVGGWRRGSELVDQRRVDHVVLLVDLHRGRLFDQPVDVERMIASDAFDRRTISATDADQFLLAAAREGFRNAVEVGHSENFRRIW